MAWAETLDASDIFIGVNALDYSGYPDCRPEFIEAFEKLAAVATKAGVTGSPIRIHTPLIQMTKREIIARGIELGVDYGLTLSCYDPAIDGAACGRCDACALRRKGFEEAGVPDPTRYQVAGVKDQVCSHRERSLVPYPTPFSVTSVADTNRREQDVYSVKEIYYTLQGEGFHTGRSAVFLRFAGCNLWSGREEDRETAICDFCDTDFVGTDGPGGGKFDTAEALATAVAREWRRHAPADGVPFTVLTGGEPLLQLDAPLITALHDRHLEIAIETNGTIRAPDDIDWVCVSPKTGTDVVQRSGDELKIVYPQPGMDVATFERLAFNHFFLQPMDGPNIVRNTELVAEYCEVHPHWKVSLQTHKIFGLP